MSKIRKALAGLGVAGLIVVAAACQIEEHAQYRQCYMDGSGWTYCTTRVGLNGNPDDGQTRASLMVACTNGTLKNGTIRQIIGTTSDYGQGTSNPEWQLLSGFCEPGNPVTGMAVNKYP